MLSLQPYSTPVFIPFLGAVSSLYLVLISITTKQHLLVIGARTRFQWCSRYSIFSLYVCFVDRCLFLVVFVLLDLQFICMFCRPLFVFSGVRVTRSLVYMYVLQIVVCFQWCSCYLIFSLYVCFVDRCLFLVVFALFDLQFISMFCGLLFVLLTFFFVIVLSVFLRFMNSDYPFHIFKIF